jgi:hypothetical protein
MRRSDDVSIPGVSRAIEGLDVDELRDAIRTEYAHVAADPGQGFHFHTGRRLTRMLGYDDAWLDGMPEECIASFAGTGNPFSLGVVRRGENVVDVGCGAGIDSLIAARVVGLQRSSFFPSYVLYSRNASTGFCGVERIAYATAPFDERTARRTPMDRPFAQMEQRAQ